MLSAVAFSSVFEHYMGDDTKREKPPAEDSSDEDDKRNSGNLYDKVKTGQISICRKCQDCSVLCANNRENVWETMQVLRSEIYSAFIERSYENNTEC